MRITVDRIEGSFMICEAQNGSMESLPHAACPEAGEGDLLLVLDDGVTVMDKEGTAQRANEIASLMDELFE